ncbi:MAG: DUF2156 domain-containing protein [Desulfobacteraceae bacterium]|nr:DUF2156 domain-containing protein [Desulfobacteraceae bacterium]
MILEFESINLEKQPAYLQRLSECPQKPSDYSFANIWGWAQEYGLSWAWKDNLVWIKQTKPQVLYWAPVGPWQDINFIEVFNATISEPAIFTRMPEELVRCLENNLGNNLTIEEERGNWDYLYHTIDLVELKGKRFHKKKNLLNQFRKKYDYTYVHLEYGMIAKALAMQTDWCTWRDCESSDMLAAENRAIEKILKNWRNLKGLVGGAVMVEDSMVAYTVAERLDRDTLLIHFEKGNPEYKGVYQAINQMFLANLTHEFTIANREQDLDDEGLRKAKLSYNPVDFLRKYKVTIS